MISYADQREEFLKASHPQLYQQMKKDGSLQDHLKQVQREASEMFDQLRAQMLVSPDLPREFQARLQAVQSIPEQVDEIVRNEIVYAL